MKKTFLLLATIILSTFMFSCDEDDDRQVYDQGALTYFNGPYSFGSDVTSRTIIMTPNSESNYSIQIGSTEVSGSDRTYTISVDPASTAVEGVAFTFNSMSATIPAGQYNATFDITVDYAGIPNEGAILFINLAGNQLAQFKTQFRLDLGKLCPSFLGGTHTYTSSSLVSGAGGGCTGTETNSGEVTWTAEGNGVYSTSDASFGQFNTCWGDSPAAGIQFQHLCNTITVDDTTSDQYGDSYSYTIVSVSGPVMVMNWTNTYGDGGTVTITRENGEDWQDELQTN